MSDIDAPPSPPPGEERPFMTVKEAAAHYRIHPNTVRRGVQDGRIPFLRVGRQIRLDPVALDAIFLRPATEPWADTFTTTRIPSSRPSRRSLSRRIDAADVGRVDTDPAPDLD